MSDEKKPPAPAPASEKLTVSEHVTKRKLEKWQVAALLGRNVASEMTEHKVMSDADFDKALHEALHAPI